MYIYMHRYIHICITFSSNSEYSGLPKAKKNSKFLFRSTKRFIKEPLGLELKDIAAYVPVFVCSHLTRPISSVMSAHFGPARVTHVCTYSFMKIKTATKPRNWRQKQKTKAKRKEKRKQVSRNDRFGRLLIKRLKFVTDVSTRHSMDAPVPISLRIPIETQPPSTLWTTRDDPTEPVQSDRYANAEETVRRNQRWIHATVLPRQNQQASTTTQLNNK